MKKPVRIWVDGSFKTKLKVLATEKNKSILDFTREFDDFETLKQQCENKEIKRKRFNELFKIR